MYIIRKQDLAKRISLLGYNRSIDSTAKPIYLYRNFVHAASYSYYSFFLLSANTVLGRREEASKQPEPDTHDGIFVDVCVRVCIFSYTKLETIF